MYDNPLIPPLDNLLARLCVADCACRLPLYVISVVFFEVILLGTAGA